MSRLNLKQVTVDGFKIKMDGEGKIKYTLEMSAAYNDEVAKQLDWIQEGAETYLPPCHQTKAGFDNTLSADKMALTPNKKELQQDYSLIIDLLLVKKFTYTHEVSGEMPMNRRIQFQAQSIENDLHIHIVNFMKTLNPGGLTATAYINYSDPVKNPKDDPQMKLTEDAQNKKFGSEGQ